MNQKELLVFYNIYGHDYHQEKILSQYIEEIDIILWHIESNNLNEKVRIVVSAVLKSDFIVYSLLLKYKEKIKIFRIDENYPVQITANRIILKSIEYFKEEYLGYFYISAGVKLNMDHDLLPRLIDKLKTNVYGIINLPVDDDNGPNTLSGDPPFSEDVYFKVNTTAENYVHNWNSLCVGLFHKSLKDFYGVPISDVHALYNNESTYSVVCSALRLKYIALGKCICHHTPKSDSSTPLVNSKGEKIKIYEPSDKTYGLLYGRTYNDIKEILDIWMDPYNYDEDFLSINDNLKYVVKKCFFTRKDEIDYESIVVEIF